jgi:cation diffusion facilitator CzcD-associated flavoprotein CzcO
VIGAAQAGLSIAARLNQLGVDTLVVEKWPRIGDSWRKSYHSLALHNSIHLNHLPYMEFPPIWPKYIPRICSGIIETAWVVLNYAEAPAGLIGLPVSANLSTAPKPSQ